MTIMMSSSFSTSFSFWLFFLLLSSSSQNVPCLLVFNGFNINFSWRISVVVIARIKIGKMAAAVVIGLE